ncbi:MAG: LL-diaminopimelate aminotransferase [Candidatus Desulforudis sp.]|nr:LL-diaminopimelate aminotransferase [Desulforudis sp.]
MEPARRIQKLSSAVFSEMDDLGRELREKGVDIINLSVGSPDLPPAPHIRQALVKALDEPGIYRYALTEGLPEFKRAVADWYGRRFGVDLDPKSEILSLIGSQDGLAHLYLALVNPGDPVLVPDPGYPIYSAGALLAEGEIHWLPLLAENGFLPELRAVPADVARRAKVMLLNYPNNPVAAVAGLDFFQAVVEFAREYRVVVVHDIAYSELAYDGYRPPSFLQAPGAREVGVELHSVSKSYNLAGCRLGFMVGNAAVLDALRVVKSNIDFGVFLAVQKAGIAALTGPQDTVREAAAVYQRRRDILVRGLGEAGWEVPSPKASMFIWAPLPRGHRSSREFVRELALRTGVVLVPGVAFGARGEGYVRIALVGADERLEEAVHRIRDSGLCSRSE